MTSSGSDEENKTASTQSQDDLWLVCPVCKQLNPASAHFCQHCWGASLNKVKPMSREEADNFVIQWKKTTKHRRNVRITVIGLVSLVLILLVGSWYIYSYTDILWGPAANLNTVSLPGEWATFHHDLDRTGSADNSTTKPQGEIKWSFQTSAEIQSSPAVAGGVIYFGSRDHNFYAVDAATGEQRWVFQTGSVVESSPAVVNGIVYFGSNDGNFYALDAATGSERWVFKTLYAVRSCPTVADNKVYFGGDDYYLYCLNAQKGTEIWKFQTRGYVTSSPVVANGIVYCDATDGACYAFNATDGRIRLKYNSMSLLYSVPAFNDGEVYFTGRGILYEINGKGRTWPEERYVRQVWSQLWGMGIAPKPPEVSGAPQLVKLLLDPKNPRSGTTSYADGASIITDTTIYTAGDNLLYSLDKKNNTINWVFSAPARIESSPALANNVLYVGCDDGHLYAIDAQNGNRLWDVTTGGKIFSSPACADGVIFVGSNDGTMYAIK